MSDPYYQALYSIKPEDLAEIALGLKGWPEHNEKSARELIEEAFRFLILCHAEIDRQQLKYWEDRMGHNPNLESNWRKDWNIKP